jgi:transposase
MEDAIAMRDQDRVPDRVDVGFWLGVGLGLLIAWLRLSRQRLTSPAASDVQTLEAMWMAAPRGPRRDERLSSEAGEQFECAGCGGLLEGRAWRFCGWCGSVLGWPTRS